VLLAQLYIKSTGQQSFFQYPKKKRHKVLPATSNWIEAFRLAYTHEILRDEQQQQLHSQLEEQRRKEEEAAEQLHSTETRRRLLRRSSMSFGTFSPLRSGSYSNLRAVFKKEGK